MDFQDELIDSFRKELEEAQACVATEPDPIIKSSHRLRLSMAQQTLMSALACKEITQT